MEAIGCLAPELWSEMHCRRGTQFYKIAQCFYVVTLNLMSPYTIVSHKMDNVLAKRQLESRKRQLGKTAVVKVGAYIVSIDRKTAIYRP